MKPICVPCQRFYRPVRNGFAFIESRPIENQALPGTLAPESWTPYKLWMGDKWRCMGCGAEIIVGTGANPVSQDFHEDFGTKVDRYGGADLLRVNDC